MCGGGTSAASCGLMVELMDAVSAAVSVLRTLLLSCGKFTQLNLFFQGVCAEIACFLPCFLLRISSTGDIYHSLIGDWYTEGE